MVIRTNEPTTPTTFGGAFGAALPQALLNIVSGTRQGPTATDTVALSEPVLVESRTQRGPKPFTILGVSGFIVIAIAVGIFLILRRR